MNYRHKLSVQIKIKVLSHTLKIFDILYNSFIITITIITIIIIVINMNIVNNIVDETIRNWMDI